MSVLSFQTDCSFKCTFCPNIRTLKVIVGQVCPTYRLHFTPRKYCKNRFRKLLEK